jgi:hypothetical protein
MSQVIVGNVAELRSSRCGSGWAKSCGSDSPRHLAYVVKHFLKNHHSLICGSTTMTDDEVFSNSIIK